MQTPLQISFAHVEQSDLVETKIRKAANHLEQFFDRITAMHVSVAKATKSRTIGDLYHVKVRIMLPGAPDIVVSCEPAATGAHEDLLVTVRDAFRAARRQLQDRARKFQGQVKVHEPPPHGRIASLHPEGDFGFIAASDGRYIYFHRNAVDKNGYDKLEVGQEVRFSESRGDQGPQASFLTPVSKHHPL